MFDRCIDYNQGFYTDFFKETIRTARKEYHCCECGEGIPVGARYEYACGRTDGDFWYARTCRTCAAIRKDFFVSWAYGRMWEDLRESYGWDPETKEQDEEWLRS